MKQPTFLQKTLGDSRGFKRHSEHKLCSETRSMTSLHTTATGSHYGKERKGCSLLLIASFFGKAQKTFQAVTRLCALGYGEDALILVRSNINLLINLVYILADPERLQRAKEFRASSVCARASFIETAYDGQQPAWIQDANMEEMKKDAKKWNSTKIYTRAKSLPASADLLHYKQGYRFYSSLEHADMMGIDAYICDRDQPGYRITGTSDQYLGIALAHNFYVMRDLLSIILHYFDIQRLDIREQLTAAGKALERMSHSERHT